jgi:hypothetical protein
MQSAQLSCAVVPALIVFLTLLVALVPPRRYGMAPAILAPGGRPAPALVDLEARMTISALRRLSLHGHLAILEADYSRGVYVSDDFEHVTWDEHASFWELVRNRGVNLIVASKRLREDARLRADADFLHFLDGTGPREDFELVRVEGTEVVIAFRRSLQ